MARKSKENMGHISYHVSVRCNNKLAFPIPLFEVWQTMEEYLYFISRAYCVDIEAFVLMPNHFHGLLKPNENNLGEAMNYFMRETSKRINFASFRINQLYGGRYNRCAIDNSLYYRHAYKYIYRNPVKAGLVKNVLDYKFSTLQGLLGKRKLIIPVKDKILLSSINSVEPTLEWLNRAPMDRHLLEIKRALSKQKFSLAQNRHSRVESELNGAEL